MTAEESLRPGRRAATTADGGELLDGFGPGQELWNGFERFAAKIQIETGNDDPFARIGKLEPTVAEGIKQSVRG